MSVLSGKIMFRAVHFITEDFSIRIEYGMIIFRWWKPYMYKELGSGKVIHNNKVHNIFNNRKNLKIL